MHSRKCKPVNYAFFAGFVGLLRAFLQVFPPCSGNRAGTTRHLADLAGGPQGQEWSGDKSGRTFR